MIVTLTAPFRWNRVVLNVGEVVDLPDVLARPLVEAEQANEVIPAAAVTTLAIDRSPANKLMQPQHRKYFSKGHP